MLPRVGQSKRHAGVFFNTGHGHLGWTLSAATAEMVAESVMESIPLDAPVHVIAGHAANAPLHQGENSADESNVAANIKKAG